jgi:hypothetical protein
LVNGFHRDGSLHEVVAGAELGAVAVPPANKKKWDTSDEKQIDSRNVVALNVNTINILLVLSV